MNQRNRPLFECVFFDNEWSQQSDDESSRIGSFIFISKQRP
jgi:hypothetical protein